MNSYHPGERFPFSAQNDRAARELDAALAAEAAREAELDRLRAAADRGHAAEAAERERERQAALLAAWKGEAKRRYLATPEEDELRANVADLMAGHGATRTGRVRRRPRRENICSYRVLRCA